MTAKRYAIGDSDAGRYWIKDEFTGTALSSNECVNLLNNLHEENQELKQSINNLIDSEPYWEQKARQRITELEKENKDLKFQLNDCLNKKLFSRRKLEKENEILKREYNTLLDLVLKSGIDYSVCDELEDI